ncbi:MAG: 50S ribosomal protein L17 [Candidatus Terrybacteria bacterium CG10_big_fil_rev_8_21_14_0_10_41_10]|uniref:Large ribosomal subunit protein bL17 n=1 Tax=Candidatus Terrybacteria bacterium CG10_big_fil_rev_8_21_14_0_10_41_10 TaxID=1975026 RepID=A0A2M8LA83_9BACT|nr:MAG: 50S ribosomal protein L17 [Candidatus Terrybacteria bacterium CG10_big_fil_rev_8_21_14_0_10_41_10]
MKHAKKGRKFGRERDQRKALMKSLVFNLVKDEKIKTTEAKAKELRPAIEKIITKAKTDNLASRRLVSSRIGQIAAKKVFDKIAPKYKDRNGGYTRIIKMAPRKSDASRMAIIEFV